MDPQTLENVTFEASHAFNMIIGDMVEKLFEAAGGPVELKMTVTEHRSGDYDPNTFQAVRPGWYFHMEGRRRGEDQLRRPSRRGFED
jgi:hypothetical protein